MKSLFYRLVGGFHHFGSDFLRVIYSILNASVILERNENLLERNENLLARNETCLAGNENCLARNETGLARNETRGGNLHLSGTVAVCSVFSFVHLSTSPRSFFRLNHVRKAWN